MKKLLKTLTTAIMFVIAAAVGAITGYAGSIIAFVGASVVSEHIALVFGYLF